MIFMKIAIYARVSTEEQRNENQLLRLRESAKSRGWIILKEYIDTISSTKQSRPQLDKMLQDARNGKFSNIFITLTHKKELYDRRKKEIRQFRTGSHWLHGNYPEGCPQTRQGF